MSRHRIDNTTKHMQDPGEKLLFLAEAAGHGPSAPIERQERDGQRQLVNSDRLPAKLNTIGQSQAEAQAEFEALGFTFGDPDEGDPMFRAATLPAGWSRKGSDHAMWSYLVDEHGRDRVSIFYKAAFYDRDAFMSLTALGWYVTQAVEYDGPAIIFDDEWASRAAVIAAMRENRDAILKEAADFREHAQDTKRRDAENREACARIAGEKEAKAALYDAALAKLGG